MAQFHLTEDIIMFVPDTIRFGASDSVTVDNVRTGQTFGVRDVTREHITNLLHEVLNFLTAPANPYEGLKPEALSLIKKHIKDGSRVLAVKEMREGVPGNLMGLREARDRVCAIAREMAVNGEISSVFDWTR